MCLEKHVPHKAQVFVCLAIQNSIPYIDNLNIRGCDNEDTNSNFCNSSEEKVDHLLLECLFSKDIWNYFTTRMNCDWSHKLAVTKQFELLISQRERNLKSKVWFILPFVLVWSLWTKMNRRAMGKKRGRDKDEVIIEIKRMVYQWGSKPNWF